MTLQPVDRHPGLQRAGLDRARPSADVVAAVRTRRRSPDAEIVIVDDGSEQPTQAPRWTRLEAPLPVRVLRQENRGRFRARKAGIEAGHGDLVLLLDSARLAATPTRWLGSARHVEDGRRVWNGHCMIDTSTAIRTGASGTCITHAAFADYLDDPRTTSFGARRVRPLPQGNGPLPRAPRAPARRHGRVRLALRRPALRQRRHAPAARTSPSASASTSRPDFACTYHSRTSLRPFLKHALLPRHDVRRRLRPAAARASSRSLVAASFRPRSRASSRCAARGSGLRRRSARSRSPPARVAARAAAAAAPTSRRSPR